MHIYTEISPRLDGTYQHGYNFDAKFVRDGILYSFGGFLDGEQYVESF